MGDLGALVEEALDPDAALATTHGLVVVHAGEVVVEHYGGELPHLDRPPTPVTADTPLLSWSIAKSMLHGAITAT